MTAPDSEQRGAVTTAAAAVIAVVLAPLQIGLESEHTKCWAAPGADWFGCMQGVFLTAAPYPAYVLVIGGFGSIALLSYTESFMLAVVWLALVSGTVVTAAPSIAASIAALVVTVAAAVALYAIHSSRF